MFPKVTYNLILFSKMSLVFVLKAKTDFFFFLILAAALRHHARSFNPGRSLKTNCLHAYLRFAKLSRLFDLFFKNIAQNKYVLWCTITGGNVLDLDPKKRFVRVKEGL